MKVSKWIMLFLISMLVVIFALRLEREPDSFRPIPTDIARTKAEKKRFRKQRKEWIESMHRAAEGVDWRSVDAAKRKEKNALKMARRASLVAEGKLTHDFSPVESAAHGSIEGIWEERGSNNQAGRMHTTDIDPQTGQIYAGSAGGNIWVGDLQGNGWTSLNDCLKIDGILMVRVLPNGVGQRLVVTQDAFNGTAYYSDNQGLNWDTSTGLDGIAAWGCLFRSIVLNDANRTIYLMALEWDYVNWNAIVTIYKSTDLGTSFGQIAVFDDRKELFDLWSPTNSVDEVYVLHGSTIYSLDSSDNLNLISTFTLNISLGDVRTTLLRGTVVGATTHLYAAYDTGSLTHFYRSTDGGQMWSAMGQVDESPFMRNSFACSNADPQKLYYGGVDCYRSDDGGLNWTKVNVWWEYYDNPDTKLHADIPGINVFNDGNGGEFVLISTDGGIYVSYDDLLTVENISLTGLRISQYYTTYTYRPDAQVIYAGSQDQGFQRTLIDPGGLIDFEQTISGDYGHIVSGDDGTSIWTVYPGFVMFYPQAATSTSEHFWYFVGSNYLWMPPLMEDPNDAFAVYLGGGGSAGEAHLWHISYAGGELTAQEETYDFSQGGGDDQVSAMAYSPLDHDYRYVLTSDGKFFHSTDGGSNWQLTQGFGGPPGHYFYGSSIVASPTVPGRVYIAGSGYSNPPVYISNDHGSNFSPMDAGLPGTLVYKLVVTPDGTTLFAATEVGPYVYVEGDGLWEDIGGISGPDQVYWSVDYVPAINTARFATYGRGIWDFQLSIDPTGVSDPTPSYVRLEQNMPNPFNASTVIHFTIPQRAHVLVTIYDVMGRRIRVLEDVTRDAGQHQLDWDGRDDHGTPAASGVYFYRLTTLGQTRAKKMVLLR